MHFIRNKFMKIFGFINHNTSGFSNIYALNVLSTSLVRFMLEYVSIVWSPHQMSYIDRSNKVQNKIF